jgi:hypothetical protein
MGPAVITTLGVLFLLSELGRGYFSFGHTFPIVLIVIGVILLTSAVAPMDGHVSTPVVPAPPAASGPAASPPPYSGPYTGQGQ